MSDESGDPNTERREADLSALRREVARLLADNESLRAMLVEQQRLLDAMEADLARYRVLWEQSRPHQPERVAGVEQQLVLAGLLQALATPVAAANDAAAAEAPAAPASADSSGSSPTPDPSHKPPTGHGRRPLDITNLPVETYPFTRFTRLKAGATQVDCRREGWRKRGADTGRRSGSASAGCA